MRALHQRVNIVPVLAKADTLTPAEVERMKNKVRSCPRLSPHLLLLSSGGSSNPLPGLCVEHSPCSQQGQSPRTCLSGGCLCHPTWEQACWVHEGHGVCGPVPSYGAEPCHALAVFFQIREEIDHYGIRIYQFPECDSDEDEEFKLQDQALKVGWVPPALWKGGRAPQSGGILSWSGPGAKEAMSHSWMLDIPWRSCHCHLQLGGKG